ncbi:MAG TPA: hypothetical protein VGF17_09615 [Phytomonospora sp.]
MSQPITRDQPIRAALLRRRWDPDGDLEPTPAPAPAVEEPQPSPEPVAEPAETLTVLTLADAALTLARSGVPGDTPVVGVTPDGQHVHLAAVTINPEGA